MSSVLGDVVSDDFKIVDVSLPAVAMGVIKPLVVMLIVLPGVEVTISSSGVVAFEVLIDGVLTADEVVEILVENVDDDNNVRKTDDVEAFVLIVVILVVI